MSGQVNDMSMSRELRGLFSNVEVCPLQVEISEVSRFDWILGENERSLWS